ncbi:hypothetical protein PZN02_000452 [Sinorhizobium garamanticum]|uniref:Uncharacterized protein n=1 Tax=Sinorhizobium garamanticum TaxID=680247 RepID=A0ABY8DAU2_9HYPH|nr:hypothetical protein [Sinorhizobium garamanticum]WEX88006.1 hypothetical protein PZN02_000452 [Sinorhizobium garamanticum]
MSEALARSICDEYGIKIVPGNVFPMPGETRAVATMARIIAKHGEGHFRMVMTELAETKGKEGLIDVFTLWAFSDLIRACPEWVEEHTSQFLDWLDELPMGWICYITSQLRGVVRQRYALAGVIHYQLWVKAQKSLAGKGATEKYAKRVRRTKEQEIQYGRELTGIKRSLPHGHFTLWVQEKSGLSLHIAHKFMRMAREADAVELKAAA